MTGAGEDPPTTFVNVPSVHSMPFDPDTGAMFPGPSLDAQSGYRGNYAIMTGAGKDLPTTFFNVPSVHPTPFNSGTGTMFPDPDLSAQSGYCGNYAIVTDDGKNLPMTFAGPSVYPAPFDSHTGNVQVKSAPTMTPYAASMSSHYHTSISSYFPEFCAPVLSNDGISMMPDSEDVLPLCMGQPLPLNEPLRFDAPSQLHLGDPLPTGEPTRSQPSRKRHQGALFIPFDPHQKRVRVWVVAEDAATSTEPSQPVIAESEQSTSQQLGIGPAEYDENHPVHKEIIRMALDTIIRSVVNETPFLSKDRRKQQVHSALTTAVCAFTKADLANQWTLENKPTLYKLLSAPSGNVMSVTRKHARDLVPRGYDLRLPLSSDKFEPKHQAQRVKHLIKEPPFPPKYIYKEGGSKPFENDVLRDVIQNTILELGYLPCVTELDSMYCTATAAVHCAMLGLKGGGNDNVEFLVRVFKPMHTGLMKFIQEYIKPHKEWSDWAHSPANSTQLPGNVDWAGQRSDISAALDAAEKFWSTVASVTGLVNRLEQPGQETGGRPPKTGRKSMEAKCKEDEVKCKEEDARLKDEAAHAKEEEIQRKEEELLRWEEELLRWEAEVIRRSDHKQKVQQDEFWKREEEIHCQCTEEKKKQEKYYEWESWGYYPPETSRPTSPPQMATSQSQSSSSSTGPWPILNRSDCSMPGPSPPTDRSSFGSTSTSHSSAGWTSSTRSSSIASTYCSNISPYYTGERICIIYRMIRASGPWADGRYVLDCDGWAGSVIIPDGDGWAQVGNM
ncbi:hypothetical protein F4604DRAFT_1952669 [Suillus subluteus]|nr:hypothetical protein F4604DRAFT_1952669 [Suillus subluteus]